MPRSSGARRQLADLDAWRTAISLELANAEKSLARQRSAFEEQLIASDFADVDALRAAIMTAPEISAAEGLNRAYAERRAITTERLRDPHLVEAARTPSHRTSKRCGAACRRAHTAPPGDRRALPRTAAIDTSG